MNNLRFLPGVYEDINAAYAWYEQQSPGLGQDLIVELEEAYALIGEFPEAWPKVGQFRKYILFRFPFNVIYKNIDNQILVVAVAHHSRKPGYWHKRK